MKDTRSSRILRRYAGGRSNPLATTPGAGKIPGFEDEIYRAKPASDLFSGEPPPINWLVEELIPRGRLGQLVADAYDGKSRILEHIACCLAVGAPVFGSYGVPKPGVSLISAPEDFADLPRLLKAHANALGVRLESIKEKLFLFEDVVDLDFPRWMEALWEETERVSADLVIIDPIQDHTYKDPNQANEIGRVFGFLRELARNTGATVFLSDHTNKRTEVPKRGFKQTGSGSGKKGKVDLSFILEPVKKSEDAILYYDKRKGLGQKEPDKLIRTVVPDELYRLEAVPWGKDTTVGLRIQILKVIQEADDESRLLITRHLEDQVKGADNVKIRFARAQLEEDGLIQSEEGPRNTLYWHITEKGRKELAQ